MEFFDAHCHLQDERLAADLDAVVRRAREAGVSGVVCCGTEEADWPRVAELAQRYEGWLIPSFGLHPWFIRRRSSHWREALEAALRSVPSGVGEIGLDFALTDFSRDEQMMVLRDQIRLARDLVRPVSIHCRKAWEPLIALLREDGPLPAGGILHAYSGAPDLVPCFEELGLTISFSGAITRSGNKKGQRSLRAVSQERMVLETDAPDLPAVGVEGGSEPAHLLFSVRSAAEILGVTEVALARRAAENARCLFGALLGREGTAGS